MCLEYKREICAAFIRIFYVDFSEILQKQEVEYPGRINPANFGKYGHTFCICEKPGQVPCPSRVKFDKPVKWWHEKTAAAE